MGSKILSDVIEINKAKCCNNLSIEKELTKFYKDIIRWAIVKLDGDVCKISVSYRTD